MVETVGPVVAAVLAVVLQRLVSKVRHPQAVRGVRVQRTLLLVVPLPTLAEVAAVNQARLLARAVLAVEVLVPQAALALLGLLTLAVAAAVVAVLAVMVLPEVQE
jgi:hypothetical protein